MECKVQSESDMVSARSSYRKNLMINVQDETSMRSVYGTYSAVCRRLSVISVIFSYRSSYRTEPIQRGAYEQNSTSRRSYLFVQKKNALTLLRIIYDFLGNEGILNKRFDSQKHNSRLFKYCQLHLT